MHWTSTPRSRVSTEKKDKEDLAEGTLLSHLVELRSRLIKATFAILVIFIPLVPFSQHLYDYAALPLTAVIPMKIPNTPPGAFVAV